MFSLRSAEPSVCPTRRELAALEQKALPRFFGVPEPRKHVLERAVDDIYSAHVATGRRGDSIFE